MKNIRTVRNKFFKNNTQLLFLLTTQFIICILSINILNNKDILESTQLDDSLLLIYVLSRAEIRHSLVCAVAVSKKKKRRRERAIDVSARNKMRVPTNVSRRNRRASRLKTLDRKLFICRRTTYAAVHCLTRRAA